MTIEEVGGFHDVCPTVAEAAAGIRCASNRRVSGEQTRNQQYLKLNGPDPINSLNIKLDHWPVAASGLKKQCTVVTVL